MICCATKASLCTSVDAVVIGFGVVALKLRPRCFNQCLGGKVRLTLRNLLGLHGVVEGQAVALADVEDT
jgi:hypothetical protein